MAGPGYEGKTNGYVNYIDTSAILEDDWLHVFVVNRSTEESARVQLQLADRKLAALERAEVVTGPDNKAVNSFEQPNTIRAQVFDQVRVSEGQAETELPRLSITALTFRLEAGRA